MLCTRLTLTDVLCLSQPATGSVNGEGSRRRFNRVRTLDCTFCLAVLSVSLALCFVVYGMLKYRVRLLSRRKIGQCRDS